MLGTELACLHFARRSVKSIVPWTGVYHVEMDVIQRTRYAFLYPFRVDLHIKWCESVVRTPLFAINVLDIYIYMNLINKEYLLIRSGHFFLNPTRNRVLLWNFYNWFTLKKTDVESEVYVWVRGAFSSLSESGESDLNWIWVVKYRWIWNNSNTGPHHFLK